MNINFKRVAEFKANLLKELKQQEISLKDNK